MPRYLYECASCSGEYIKFHLIAEKHEVCELCGEADSIKRAPGHTFISSNKVVEKREKKIGETTKEHIEENREILKKMKKQQLKKVYTE